MRLVVSSQQGLRQDQLVTFVTDGADDLAGFCEHMNLRAEYVLDWFHIAMRFTVLTNTATGITWTPDDDEIDVDEDWCTAKVDAMPKAFGRAKWFLWHGNQRRALQVLHDAADTLYCALRAVRILDRGDWSTVGTKPNRRVVPSWVVTVPHTAWNQPSRRDVCSLE